jgi:PPOX class probable F420-dependent enzyme
MPDFPEAHRDLLSAPVATLSTLGRDGFPQVTATWFVFDPEDGALKLWLSSGRQKTRNLRRDPRCTLLIMDPDSTQRTLEVRAHAEVADDKERAFVEQLVPKYGEFVRNIGDQPPDYRVLVTLRPTKINVTDLRRPRP